MSNNSFVEYLKFYKKSNPKKILNNNLSPTILKNYNILLSRKINNPLIDIYEDVCDEFNPSHRRGAGVTIITPRQTISTLLEPNHFFHDETLILVDSIIYGDVWFKELRKQNIEIKYFFSKESALIILDVPVPINSDQKSELKKINAQIKNFQKKFNVEINVCYSINSGRYSYNSFDSVNCDFEENLDNLLKKVKVDDNCVPRYQDRYIVGNIINELKIDNDFNFEELQILFYEYLITMTNFCDLKFADFEWLEYLNSDNLKIEIINFNSYINDILCEIDKYNMYLKDKEDLKYFESYFKGVQNKVNAFYNSLGICKEKKLCKGILRQKNIRFK